MPVITHPKIVKASALKRPGVGDDIVIPTTDVVGKPMLGGRVDPRWEEMGPRERDDLIRRKRFWRLAPEEFEAFKGECAIRGFSIYCQHLHPYMEWDAETQKNQLRLYVHIGAMRVIAKRDPTFEGYTRPRVLYSGKDEKWRETWQTSVGGYPAFAKVGVYVRGHREAVEHIAAWEECAIYTDGPGGRTLSQTWADRSLTMLAKCAEAGALRIACPESMSGLYLDKEEMDKVRADREPAKAPEDQRPKYAPEDTFDDDDLPWVESPEELADAMANAGHVTKDEQDQVMADARGKYPKARSNSPLLMRLVMRDMRTKLRAGV